MIRLSIPPFWLERGAAAWLLWPLSWLYRFGVFFRRLTTIPYRAAMPVICIGNAVAGGAGKTPLAIYVIGRALALKLAVKPCFIMRGYKGSLKGPLVVAPGHTAAEVGDEALLLARHGPVVVARDRAAGLRFAGRQGFDLAIADDGLQNPSFEKTFSLLAVDGAFGFGNRFLLPAGPLRDTLGHTYRQCAAAVVSGTATADLHLPPSLARFDATLVPAAGHVPPAVFAFAGIGRPDKFFDTLRAAGHTLAGMKSFPDHHDFTDAQMTLLVAQAAQTGATLVTTEKDWVRLGPRWRTQVRAFPVALAIGDHEGFDALLAKGLGR